MNKYQRKFASETKDFINAKKIDELYSFGLIRKALRNKFKQRMSPYAMKSLCNNCCGDCHGRQPTRLAYCKYWD